MKQINLGVLGAGQLGQMMAEETLHHGISFQCYSPDLDSPIQKIGIPVTKGNYEDLNLLEEFLSNLDILTFEFENIPKNTLLFLEAWAKKTNLKIFPNPNALMIAQDRYLEKSHFQRMGLKTPSFHLLSKDHRECNIKFPWIIKTLRFGYDGKGQTKVKDSEDYAVFLKNAFNHGDEEYLIEEQIHFDLEVSVILTRFQDGSIQTYGTVENIHKNHILDLSIFPARITEILSFRTVQIAKELASSLDYVGTLGVEFFIKGEDIYLNEFAPRPHNSGHFSQDCGSISQFKLHIGAVTGLFNSQLSHMKPTVMKNILGDKYDESLNIVYELLKDDRYVLHLYGKSESRNGRKMGHLNFRGRFEEVSPLFSNI
jgi:5-(carboxyamino)imidazole ribonucleotide synthase